MPEHKEEIKTEINVDQSMHVDLSGQRIRLSFDELLTTFKDIDPRATSLDLATTTLKDWVLTS